MRTYQILKKSGHRTAIQKQLQLKSSIQYLFRTRIHTCIRICIFVCSALFAGQLHSQSSQSRQTVQLQIQHLKTQQRSGAAGMFISTSSPRLSWEVVGAESVSAAQATPAAFQVLVAKSKSVLKQQIQGARTQPAKLVWNSGKITSAHGLSVIYSGSPLASAQTFYWVVKVWNKDGRQSQWSPVDSFQTALFARKDWNAAQWIGAEKMQPAARILPGDTALKTRPFGTVNDHLPLLRKSFHLNKGKGQVKKATLFISGLGQFEASVNGQKIGDHFLDPGWTNYQKEALYVGLDVTGHLQKDLNVIGVELGNGFYYIPNEKHRYKKLLVQYGYPKMICRLVIEYTDGTCQDIVSDKSWKQATSPVLFSSIYGGELEDGRLRPQGWNQPHFNATTWKPVQVVCDTPQSLHLQRIDPIRFMDSFAPVAVFMGKKEVKRSGSVSCWVYDMGQNCSGIPAITVHGKKGDTITLIPAELLTRDSAANQKATGSPYRLTYILGKDGAQHWQPKFTYYGLRYVQLEGAVPAGKPNPKHLPVIEEIKTLHVRNSAPVAGHFECSNELFNQTNELIKWGMKSNMMSVFTDCPHREKLGWLEQVHLMGNSVRYNWQIAHMLKKTIRDMRQSQTPKGLVPAIAPEFTVFDWGGDMFRDSPEWGSSAIVVPWYLYEWYGDSSELRNSYGMMTRYNKYLQSKAKSHILYQGLGDWYDLGPKPPGVSQLTPMGITGTAIHYYDLQILQKIAALLDKPGDQADFTRQAAAVKKAFNETFLQHQKDSLGQWQSYYGTGSQTADAMALYMNLVPDSLHDQVVQHLVTGIRAGGYALTAGDIGYRYLLRVLEQEGYSTVIFKMNNRRDVPGYGYQLSHGATALTESWQALPTVSNNHFMLGHLMEWFYSGILGIRMDRQTPGGSQLIIQPEMVGDLTWAKGDYQTPYGPVRVHWEKNKKGIVCKLHLPVGTRAVVRLPMKKKGKLQAARPSAAMALRIQKAAVKEIKGHQKVEFVATAGNHEFSITYP